MSDTLTLKLGDRIRFAEDRFKFTVRAVAGHFAVCTRQAQFEPKGTLVYTVIDHAQNIRGPVNVIGQGWDVESDEQCLELADLLVAGKWEVSHRNRLPLSYTVV